MSTLGEMKARGEGIILYCVGNIGVRWCNRSQKPSMDQLIQYFGVDYNLVANRAQFLSRFVCKVCGARNPSLQLDRPPDPTRNGGIPDRMPEPPPPPIIDEAARAAMAADAAREAARLQFLRERDAQFVARRKERQRIEALAEKGVFVIGPPDPRKYRKRS